MNRTGALRRPSTIIAFVVIAALIVGAAIWWGTARASAKDAAAQAADQVATAHAAAATASADAATAEERRTLLLESAVIPTLDVAETHPDSLDPGLIDQLRNLQEQAEEIEAAPEFEELDSLYIDKGRALVGTMMWSREKADATATKAAAALEEMRSKLESHRAAVDEWSDQTAGTMTAIAEAAALGADGAIAEFEYADDAAKNALAENAAALRNLTLDGEDSRWSEFSTLLEGYAANVATARAGHEARAAEIQAEQAAANQRAAAEAQRQQAANRRGSGGGAAPAPSGGGGAAPAPSGGGGAAPAPSGGGGGGGGASCTFVNWQGMVMSRPC